MFFFKKRNVDFGTVISLILAMTIKPSNVTISVEATASLVLLKFPTLTFSSERRAAKTDVNYDESFAAKVIHFASFFPKIT